MRNLKATTLLMAALGMALAETSAQERQVITMGTQEGMPMLPGMMNPRNIKTGKGRIRGRILSAESGSPVRRVQVRISGTDILAKTMLTDADGKFEFIDLPPGRFNVSATKAGYVTVQYGQTRPFESGKAIELADAQVLDKADIVMPRGSVISGRIVDEFGEPITDATVSAMRSVWSGGRRRLQQAGRSATTNDLGQFRIFGLPPGDYYVSASYRGGTEMMVMESSVVASFIGASSPGSGPTSGYAPTYYPGTTSGPDAQKVTVGVGQEMHGADFALAAVKLVKITGTAMRSDGRPAEGSMVTLLPRTTETGFFSLERGGRVDKNGAFTINSVAPGEYNLQVRGMNIQMTGGGDTFTIRTTIAGGGGGSGEEAEFASVPVVVSGEDVTNVAVVTAKGATASGRVTFEGGAQPQSLTGIRVTTVGTESEGLAIAFPGAPGAAAPGSLSEDGAFELRGLAGSRLFRVAGLPPGWMLKSVRVEGNDVTDTGFDFKAGSTLTGVDVVLSARTTTVNGTVTGANGQPVKDYTAVIFADDQPKWTLPNSRYVTGVRPDQDGRFTVRNLPAGDYVAVAVEYLAQGEWGDPDVLQRLRPKATRFSLNEGDNKTLTLPLR